MPKEAEKQEKLLGLGIHPNVLVFEDTFVKHYHNVEKESKEREIKFFKCIGDPALGDEERFKIIKQKAENKEHFIENNKNNDLHRYDVVDSNERVTIPVDLPLKPECKWNILSNDLFSLRQRHLNNLVKISTTLMVRIRVNARLAKLKARFDEVWCFSY